MIYYFAPDAEQFWVWITPAEIERASPWGKVQGEEVPGEKRKIGAAAAHADYETRLPLV